MNETVLKVSLVQVARSYKGFVVIRHEDRFTHGIPDLSITYKKRTFWLEVKYADPKFSTKGIQELTMMRLALAGFAYFIIYYEKGKEKRTFIVHPKDIGKSFDELLTCCPNTDEFDHDYVIRFIQELSNKKEIINDYY